MSRLAAPITIAAALLGCGSRDAGRVDGSPGDVTTDSPIDAGPRCDVTSPFGPPSLVDGVNTTDDDRWGWESADGLTIYFARAPAGGEAFDLYVATRGDPEAPFSATSVLATSTPFSEKRPVVTADGLTLYMETTGSASDTDIRVATRTDTTVDFPSSVSIAGVDGPKNEFNPWISGDGLTLYFTSDRDGYNDIFMTTRATADASFATPVAVTELNSAYGDYMGALRGDGLEIFFGSSRDTNLANDDIFHATRASPSEPFGATSKIAELSGATTNEYPSWVSADGCQLLFTSNRGGAGYDIWLASRPQ